ncbi:hypothetical protein LC593_23150 [Nostoc sp. CHAB 5844]|nr:hypothetical protein [Nostoc sp. CHAB 5844]
MYLRNSSRPSQPLVTPLYALAVNFPLVEVTVDNGPCQMARGTHLLPREEGLQKIASGEIPMESFYMQPGDVIVHRNGVGPQEELPRMVSRQSRDWRGLG